MFSRKRSKISTSVPGGAERELSDTTGDPRVAACVIDKIRGWLFTTTPPGIVQHRFKFAAARGCVVPQADWTFVTAGSFIYGVLPGDTLSPEAMKQNEAARAEIAQFLGVEDTAPIHYYKYPNISTKWKLTGLTSNAHSCARALHTSSTNDRHEITHILAASLGRPPALLQEGLAVYMSGSWQGMPIEVYSRGVLLGEAWRPLSELVGEESFLAADKASPVASGEAGMLIWWIVRTYGKDKLLELYRSIPAGNAALDAIESALGASLACIDRDIRTYLLGTPYNIDTPDVGGCSAGRDVPNH